jgi:hypothetical protein
LKLANANTDATNATMDLRFMGLLPEMERRVYAFACPREVIPAQRSRAGFTATYDKISVISKAFADGSPRIQLQFHPPDH